MEKIRFVKMSGAGNTFAIIDNRSNLIPINRDVLAKKICKKNKLDGLLLLENSQNSNFKMRIFNPDGSEAEMCGNGVRCISYFAYKNSIVKRKMEIETLAGIIMTEVNEKLVKVRMSKPTDLKLNIDLFIDNKRYIAHYINTGVPHTILFVNDVEKVNVNKTGSKIRYHISFSPKGTNVNFVEILDNNKIKIRTYERGVERETLACGTGSVASSLISVILKKVKMPVKVITRNKEILVIEIDKKANIYMSGPVKTIGSGNTTIGG